MKGRSKEGTTEEIPPLFEFSFYNETRFFSFSILVYTYLTLSFITFLFVLSNQLGFSCRALHLALSTCFRLIKSDNLYEDRYKWYIMFVYNPTYLNIQ